MTASRSRSRSRSRIAIFMPKMGYATGEMPHLRNPPKNWMPGQNLYYLYTACRNLGHESRVVDANWSRDPVGDVLEMQADKVLVSTTTPAFQNALSAIDELRARGYAGEVFISGPHVSLNHGLRELLLPPLEDATYIPIINSYSSFEWVPRVFPGRSPFEVLGHESEEEARRELIGRWTQDTGRTPKANLESYLFTYFEPSFEWMADTYQGKHIRPEMRSIPIRYSLITSIGCSKTCSFCGNPYIYRIGFKNKEIVRKIARDYVSHGIDHVSVHDMYFVMSPHHASEMIQVFREEGLAFSMQTCLENLDEALLDQLEEAGLRKFLVGVENPASYSVGKKVELQQVFWLLDQVARRRIEGVKLSYIVGLPGVALDTDLALLDHIVSEIRSRNHPLEDLQVNLYTPYRPEPETRYLPLDEPPRRGALSVITRDDTVRDTVYILTRIPYSYWGCFPVGIHHEEHFHTQMVLCDVVYSEVYSEFLGPYLELRERYLDVVRARYPLLSRHAPAFEESVALYRNHTKRSARDERRMQTLG